MKLSHHQKHETRRWFHARGENLLDLLESSESDPCDLCDDHQWWIDNGYTDAERLAICAYLCPPSEK